MKAVVNLSLSLSLIVIISSQAQEAAPAPTNLTVKIHNGLVSAPAGVAFVVDDETAFAFDVGRAPGSPMQFLGQQWTLAGCRPGVAAPDDSIHELVLENPAPDQVSWVGGDSLRWDWGRVGDGIVGRLRVDQPTTVSLRLLNETWPGFKSATQPTADGAKGEAVLQNGRRITWRLITSPAPDSSTNGTLLLAVAPQKPVYLVAGIGDLPELAQVDRILKEAGRAYQEKRPAAEGAWGDFVGAIADNMNNSRTYSSDLHLLAHTVSRRCAQDPNSAVVFSWDSFFNGALACLDDPEAARDTIRAVLGAHAMIDQPADGMVPNYAHWNFRGNHESPDRSGPPVGALCVWKIHQRWPDKAFLAEVYPNLKKWHAWWQAHRDGRHDGLLEWGCDLDKMATNEIKKGKDMGMQGARWETGWDDTPHFTEAKMVGSTMNAYAVDLNSLWSTDAEYLALMADVLGLPQDAAMFREQHRQMNQKINEMLWNEELGTYCSRLWPEDGKPGRFLTRLTPMNFYPLICGAPDAARAARVLKVLTNPALFWGRWKLPTVAYDDPIYGMQIYWHGTVWPPVNYLVFQGLKRYGTPEQRNEFARCSLDLFMRNWEISGVCGENYLSTTGAQASISADRNYTWGALLCLIGVENIIDQTDDGKIVLGQDLKDNVTLRNIPLGGKRYQVQVQNGQSGMTVIKE